MLDVTALVIGAAIASVHTRAAFLNQQAGPGRWIVGVAFLGIAITASGPFLAWVRLEKIGETDGIRYWRALGWPWAAAAIVRAAAPWARGTVLVILVGGLLLAGAFAVVELWRTRIRLGVDQTPPAPIVARHWTDSFGIALAIAWPWQFAGVLLIQEPA